MQHLFWPICFLLTRSPTAQITVGPSSEHRLLFPIVFGNALRPHTGKVLLAGA